MTRHSYFIINIVFAGLILAIFVYSGFYDPKKDSYPIKCIHTELLGGKCPTCGMSHGFSAILRGHFDEAIHFQKNSIPVFSFFILQFFMRVLLLFMLLRTKVSESFLANIDITVSLLLFIFLFKNLVLQTFYIFYKMILTGNTN